MDVLGLLQKWFQAQCDGTWEHGSAVEIASLDNPGWSVRIHLAGTSLAGQQFKEVRRSEHEMAWINCRVCDNKFEGFGGPYMLEEILKVFLNWAAEAGRV